MSETTQNTAAAPLTGTAADKKIVVSGIRSTGNLHLGNYYGALSKFLRMQDDYDCRFFIADLHALTTNPDPKQLHESVKNILAEYLAAGLDPDKSTLYVQSDVPDVKSTLPEGTTVWVGAIDDEVNSHSYIVPGLGDAGDLAYGEKD